MSDIMDPQTTGDNPNNDNGAGANAGAEGAGEQQQAQQTQQTTTSDLPRWMYQLSGDLQKDDRLSGFTKPDELAKAYLDYAGKADKLIELPGEKDAEGWKKFYGKLGRPETPEGYDFSGVSIPETIEKSELADFRNMAHELGLSKAQAAKLLEHSIADLNSITTKADENAKAEAQKKLDEKKQKIGALVEKYGDNFEEIVTKAHRAYEAVGSKELGEYLDSSGLGDDPVMVGAFLSIAEKIGEDTLFGSSHGGGRDEGADWYPNTNFDS
ncbi:hypothetical protein [Sediminispirochaeta smaragdinae]|uniref:Uncharacterized protein n=1 Tax=Sediminispirochaeta smaragdinae (strain DSM 11293 / JCM 15392 / SEBR 4228) TaxID=573413 RepID=E1R223_SEDSS|nr:hypothetical protein [Sediminispirochaeta smaragdinae]ADK81908.1 hypothetical protein Spirs_2805 [Sediminispirochaeta smaragdinae DSM 11293]